MRYADFDKLILQMATSASDSARREFALDTIARLHALAEIAIREEFTEAECLLLDEIVAGVETLPAIVLKRKVQELDDSQCRDPIRAIEFNPKVTDFVAALDSWADYRLNKDPMHVAGIAINMVNAVDYDIGGHTEKYSTENILGAQAMVVEHDRQKRLLAAAD